MIDYKSIFIAQSPVAMAMLDVNLRCIVVSKKWLADYQVDKEIIGSCLYDVFPSLKNICERIHDDCVRAGVNVSENVRFELKDGSVVWLFWDINPWYNDDGTVGGVMIQTRNITKQKEHDFNKKRIDKILKKTSEVARIGVWELDLKSNEVFWDKMIREIHDVPDGYYPIFEEAVNFFKAGYSRRLIANAMQNVMVDGESFDIDLQLVTYNDKEIWVRVIGQAEFENEVCVNVFGVCQDINVKKLTEIALSKANDEITTIMNSGSIAIISSNEDGVIKHFNNGAEAMLGYSAFEMIGKQKAEIFHVKEELSDFKADIKQLKDSSSDDALCDISREWLYKRKDGSVFPVESTLTIIKNKEGVGIGYLEKSIDVSQRKKAETEILRKNELLSFAELVTMTGNWQWDVETNLVIGSTNLYRIFGLDQSREITIETCLNLAHKDDELRVRAHLKNAVKNRFYGDILHRIQLDDGTIKTLQFSGKAIENKKGEVVEVIGACQDVTEQRMAEIKFRSLLESAPDAMVITNENGIIQLVNKQAELLFGIKSAELISECISVVIPKRYVDIGKLHFENFFTKPRSRKMKKNLVLHGTHKDKTKIPIQVSLSPLQTAEGVLFSVAIRDVTRQKLAERRIIQAKEELELLATQLRKQNTQLADFAHITSHNLRAPVSNLNALLNIYNITESEDDKFEVFDKFKIVIDHLTSTLDILVDAIKVTNENDHVIEEVLFEDVLTKTKEMLMGQILKTVAVIEADFSAISTISYCKVYLESIFLNLVSNSLKYKSDERAPKVLITSEKEGGKIKIKIKDNGMGIDLERHGHKLFGLNKVFHRHPDAKGVGLFITKIQVEAMGGKISASSTVGVGTVFNIDFN